MARLIGLAAFGAIGARVGGSNVIGAARVTFPRRRPDGRESIDLRPHRAGHLSTLRHLARLG